MYRRGDRAETELGSGVLCWVFSVVTFWHVVIKTAEHNVHWILSKYSQQVQGGARVRSDAVTIKTSRPATSPCHPSLSFNYGDIQLGKMNQKFAQTGTSAYQWIKHPTRKPCIQQSELSLSRDNINRAHVPLTDYKGYLHFWRAKFKLSSMFTWSARKTDTI